VPPGTNIGFVEETTVNIGFIGMGTMGAPMAGRLIEAGHDLTIHNGTRAREEALARLMSVLLAPATQLVRTVAEPHAGLVRVVEAMREARAETA